MLTEIYSKDGKVENVCGSVLISYQSSEVCMTMVEYTEFGSTLPDLDDII
jgi:hypothetical protein